MGSDIGASFDEPVRMLCNVLAFEFCEVKVEGRLRKVRHIELFRHRLSSDVFMDCRYVSKPLRRSSVSSGEDTVLVNHDFEGKGAGGAAAAD